MQAAEVQEEEEGKQTGGQEPPRNPPLLGLSVGPNDLDVLVGETVQADDLVELEMP